MKVSPILLLSVCVACGFGAAMLYMMTYTVNKPPVFSSPARGLGESMVSLDGWKLGNKCIKNDMAGLMVRDDGVVFVGNLVDPYFANHRVWIKEKYVESSELLIMAKMKKNDKPSLPAKTLIDSISSLEGWRLGRNGYSCIVNEKMNVAVSLDGSVSLWKQNVIVDIYRGDETFLTAKCVGAYAKLLALKHKEEFGNLDNTDVPVKDGSPSVTLIASLQEASDWKLSHFPVGGGCCLQNDKAKITVLPNGEVLLTHTVGGSKIDIFDADRGDIVRAYKKAVAKKFIELFK